MARSPWQRRERAVGIGIKSTGMVRARITEARLHPVPGGYSSPRSGAVIGKWVRFQIVINSRFELIANNRGYAGFAKSVRMAVYQTTRHATPAPMLSEPRACPGLWL